MFPLAPRARSPLAFVRLASLGYRPRRRLLPGVVALIACLGAAPATADDQHPAPHLRSADRQIRDRILEGCRRSPTFRRLVDELEQSDVIVYLEATRQVPRPMQAYLQLAGAAPGVRFLRVAVRIPASPDTLISQIGHELQHATEIGGAPEVRDQAGMDTLYSSIGDRNGVGWDTAAARLAGTTVLDELRHPERLLNADARPVDAIHAVVHPGQVK